MYVGAQYVLVLVATFAILTWHHALPRSVVVVAVAAISGPTSGTISRKPLKMARISAYGTWRIGPRIKYSTAATSAISSS